jgi:hypothetical protein
MTEDKNNAINIIGTTTACVHPDCQGWLVDSILGRYFVECLDPKHNVTKKQVENGGQSMISTKEAVNSQQENSQDDH